jgi:hypothetical protein
MSTLEDIKNKVTDAAVYLKNKMSCGVCVETKSKAIVNPYYTDTIAKVGEEVPFLTEVQKVENDAKPQIERQSLLDAQFDDLSKQIDAELEKSNDALAKIDFEKLQELIHKIVMLHMRKAAKVDQEYISELAIQIKAQGSQIQGTYNTWPGVVITVVSATVSIAGGAFGLAPLAPAIINPETAKVLAAASTPISTAGTGVGGLGTLANNDSEAKRQVWQLELKRKQDKEEDRKGAKHGNKETQKAARAAQDEFNRNKHEVTRSMTNS